MNIFSKLRPETHVKKTLTVQLTDVEYRMLIRAVDMGGHVYGISGDMIDEKYKSLGDDIDEVQNRLLEHASEFGMQNEIEMFDDKPVLVNRFTEATIDDLMEFEEIAMWEGMEHEFAVRDLHRSYTNEEWQTFGIEKRIDLIYQAETHWSDEFEKHGFKRLEIVEREKK